MKTTLPSASGIISRTRSSPVTPKMHRALRQQMRDLGRRQIGDLDAGQIGDRAAIVARAARLDQLEPGAREEASAFSCSRPLAGTAMTKGALMARSRSAASRSIQTAKPTAGIGVRAAEPASASRRSGRRRPAGSAARLRRIVQLELRSRCSSRGRVPNAVAKRMRGDVDAARRQETRCGSRTGRATRSSLSLASRASARSSAAAASGSPLDREKALDQRARLAAAARSARRARPAPESGRRSRRPSGRRRR